MKLKRNNSKKIIFNSSFLSGFLKGVLILFLAKMAAIIILLFYMYITGDNIQLVKSSPFAFRLQIFVILTSYLYGFYVILKHKLSKAWMILVLVFGLFVLPFLFASIETVGIKKKLK